MSTGRKVAWTLCTATPIKTFRALSNSCKEEDMAHHFMVSMHEDHTQKLREWKAKKKRRISFVEPLPKWANKEVYDNTISITPT
jgi:hypothetical protein